MTDEHLQSRLDAIAREQKEKEEAKASYEKEKHSGDEQLAQVRKRQEEVAQTLAEIQKQIASCNEGMEQGQKELFALLNRRADIQAKQQRSDTMVEQINIRKAELGKRLLDRKRRKRIWIRFLQTVKRSRRGQCAYPKTFGAGKRIKCKGKRMENQGKGK